MLLRRVGSSLKYFNYSRVACRSYVDQAKGRNYVSIKDSQLPRLLHRAIISNNMDDAEDVISIMKQKDISLSKEDYIHLLKAYSRSDPSKVAYYLQKYVDDKHALDIDTINHVIGNYCSIGAIQLASKLLYQVISIGLKPNLQTFHPLILSFAREKQYANCVTLLPLLRSQNIKASPKLYEVFLLALVKEKKPSEAVLLMKEVNSFGIRISKSMQERLFTELINRYYLQDALTLFRNDFDKTTKSSEEIIRGYINCDLPLQARNVYEEVVSEKKPVSFNMAKLIINDFINRGNVPAAFKFHDKLPENFLNTPHMYIVLLEALLKNRITEKANDMMYRLQNRFEIPVHKRMFDIRINLALQNGNNEKASELIEEMKDNELFPDVTTFNIFMDHFTNANAPADNWNEIDNLITTMVENGVVPNEITYEKIINYCVKVCNNQMKACEYYQLLERQYLGKQNIQCLSLLFETLVKEKNFAGARAMLNDFKEYEEQKSSYHVLNTIIKCYALLSDTSGTVEYFDKCKEKRIHPTRETYNWVIYSFCRHSDIGKALEYLHEMKEIGMTPNVDTYYHLIWCCARAGDMGYVTKYLEKLNNLTKKVPTYVFEWIAAGYYKQKQPEKAKEFIETVGIEDNDKLSSKDYFD